MSGTLIPSFVSVVVSGTTVTATASPLLVDGGTVTAGVVSTETVLVNYVPGTNKIKDLSGNLASALTSQATTNGSALPPTPAHIFTGGQLAAWYRADAGTFSGGKCTQRTDMSGNARHEVAIGTSPDPAREPTFAATDARINNRPILQYKGEAETSANRDATGVTWTRAAPGTTNRFIARIFCQEGPNGGTIRYCFGDASGAFSCRRPSGVGSSDATLVQLNGSTVNSNSAPVDTVIKRHVTYFSNSLSTDYHQWGSTIANGQNAGNLAGTARQTALNPAGNAWAFISVAEEVEVEKSLGPSLLQLSQLDAYFSYWYGSGVLT